MKKFFIICLLLFFTSAKVSAEYIPRYLIPKVESIATYSNAHYDCYIFSDIIEGQIREYYGREKELEFYIYRRIKSPAYLNFVKRHILTEYPEPVYSPKHFISLMDEYKYVFTFEEVHYDFKARTVTIFSEGILGLRSETDSFFIPILELDYDESFHKSKIIWNFDNNIEYGTIANSAIAFLESKKDNYFGANKHREFNY